MAKPERQDSTGVSLFIDGIIAKRIQSVSVDVDVTREQILELANSGVVENVRESDAVNVSIESNDIGSTDTLALLADKMITYTAADATAGPRNNFDGSQHKWFIKTDSSNASYRTIQITDLLNNYSNILVAVNENATAVARTMWAPRCAITNLSLSYDVNGDATESFTLVGDKKFWYQNAWKAARLYKPINNQIFRYGPMHGFNYASSISFGGLSSCMPAGATPIAVLLNDRVVQSGLVQAGGTWEFSPMGMTATPDALSASTFSITHRSGSQGLPFSTPFVSTGDGQKAAILWYGGIEDDWNAKSTYGYELESTAGAIGAIRKGQIKCFLFNRQTGTNDTATTAGTALRLQSVTIDASLGEDRLFELGRLGHYAISKKTPVPVNVTVSINDTDAEYYAWITGSEKDSGPNYLSSESFTGGNELVIEIYKDTDQTTLLKTVTVNKMDVQTESFNVSVGGEATQEISFLADNILIAGQGDNTGTGNVSGGWDFS